MKVIYHECYGTNITGCRGETNYFIDGLTVLDKNFTENLKFNSTGGTGVGKTDTIFVVVINPNDVERYIKTLKH